MKMIKPFVSMAMVFCIFFAATYGSMKDVLATGFSTIILSMIVMDE